VLELHSSRNCSPSPCGARLVASATASSLSGAERIPLWLYRTRKGGLARAKGGRVWLTETLSTPGPHEIALEGTALIVCS
jgi:hypothetical protein